MYVGMLAECMLVYVVGMLVEYCCMLVENVGRICMLVEYCLNVSFISICTVDCRTDNQYENPCK